MITLEVNITTPKHPTTEVQKQIDDLGIETFNLLQTFEHIKQEIKSDDNKRPHVIWQLIKGFVAALSTQDPNRVHYEIVRECLRAIDGNLLGNTRAVDMLARELNENCKKLHLRLTPPNDFQEQLKLSKQDSDKVAALNGYSNEPPPLLEVLKLPDDCVDFEQDFEKDGMFLWDKIFLTALSNTGKEGQRIAIDIKPKLQEKLLRFASEGVSPLSFWVNITPTEKPFYLSPALQILTNALWEDTVEKIINFAEKNVTAITKRTLEPIKKILSPKSEIIVDQKQIQLFYQDSLVCNVNIPTISQKMSHIVLCGAKKLNTVIGHRVIRHFPQEAFRQRINGYSDYRVLNYDRGATDVAEKLGVKSNKTVTAINQAIHAMAYLEFSSPQLSGNLIQLSKYKSPITKRIEAFQIVVGTPLLPYQTFEEHGSLLTPILSDPPLVNPNQTHAGQYLLQMELMEEFSNQSILIAEEDVVRITQHQWETLAQSSGLSVEILKKVQDRWTQDGMDGEKLLEKVERDFYKLGPKFNKEWTFLREQGLIRIKNSKRGKASALKRINAKRTR